MFLGALYRLLIMPQTFSGARLILLQKIITNSKGYLFFWQTDVSGDIFLCETNKRVKSRVVQRRRRERLIVTH